MDTAILLLLCILPALVITAGVSDLTTMKIPNWISGALILAFFPTALAVGLPLDRLALHLGVGLVALLIGMSLFAARIVGGGDAKLIAASAIWMGATGAPTFVVWTALAGGAFTLILLMMRSRMGVLATMGPNWFHRLMQPKGDIPYGIAIAFGALMAFPMTPLVQAWLAL